MLNVFNGESCKKTFYSRIFIIPTRKLEVIKASFSSRSNIICIRLKNSPKFRQKNGLWRKIHWIFYWKWNEISMFFLVSIFEVKRTSLHFLGSLLDIEVLTKTRKISMYGPYSMGMGILLHIKKYATVKNGSQTLSVSKRLSVINRL